MHAAAAVGDIASSHSDYGCNDSQVCQRMGLRMAARPLEGGRYFILWPCEAPLRSCGAQFVIDAYSQGEVFLLDEARTFQACPCTTHAEQRPV